MNNSRRGISALAFVLLVLAGIVILSFAIQLGRMPEIRSRTRAHRVREAMREWAGRLEQSRQSSGMYPSSFPFQVKVKQVPAFVSELGSLPAPGAMDEFTDKGPLAYMTDGKRWVMISAGPDECYSLPPKLFLAGRLAASDLADATYDPTNGSFSGGDIYLAGPAPSP